MGTSAVGTKKAQHDLLYNSCDCTSTDSSRIIAALEIEPTQTGINIVVYPRRRRYLLIAL